MPVYVAPPLFVRGDRRLGPAGAFFRGARAANGFLGAASLTPSPRPRLFMNSALRRTRILRSSS